MQVSLGRKIKELSELRQKIKKNKLILDESKEKFGSDQLTPLKKVKNTSEIKGYPFKMTKDGIIMSVKILPIETKYEKYEHPCYIENIVLKELTDNIILKGISPHIAYYLGTQKVNNKSKALQFLNLHKLEIENTIKNYSNMLISEYVSGGSLNQWVYSVYENKETISDEQWKSIVFQLIYTISILQHHYRMMHNDFHYGNILIDNSIKPGGYFVYEIMGEKYYIKNNGVIPKLWDFEFSMIYSDKIANYYPNKFITGPYEYDKKLHKTIVDKDVDKYNKDVPYNYNEVYDLHYFLTSLLDLYISQELFDWIMDIYPYELIPDENSTSINLTNISTISDNDLSKTSTSTSNSTSNSTSGDSPSDSSNHSTSNSTNNSSNHSPSDSSSDSSSNSSSNSLSDSLSDSPSDSSSSSSSSSSSGSSSSSTSSSSIDSTSDSEGKTKESMYLIEGRIINGVEQKFDLPNSKSLIKSDFFGSFKNVPKDFDEKNAIYLKAGF